MTVTDCSSIPELSSDHNPVLFELNLFLKKPFQVPSLVGPMGLHYSTQDKVDLFADSLRELLQENSEPYDDDFIDHVEERVDNFFLHRNSRRHTAPLTSPQK
ncbi:hypothetical protein TNCV_1273021 [Trichonephila clavipes]|nr:hypothetical protein TNCV_1273021 [Trichonephila clavipes]